MFEELITATVPIKVASATMYASSGAALLSGGAVIGDIVTADNIVAVIGAVVGAIIAIGGFIVSTYLKWRQTKLLEEYLRKRYEQGHELSDSDLAKLTGGS